MLELHAVKSTEWIDWVPSLHYSDDCGASVFMHMLWARRYFRLFRFPYILAQNVVHRAASLVRSCISLDLTHYQAQVFIGVCGACHEDVEGVSAVIARRGKLCFVMGDVLFAEPSLMLHSLV